ncbi:MAG: hypothetical protein NZ841_04295 [Dictyoglomus sp.]|nr:hypothetical protein [Dictyoglomus sp.]MCX7846220.1 hypothetical protein [Dictyoglomaceae bacterium]MDW8188496.1 hypothetical protein [Dictyoglomus sp.]
MRRSFMKIKVATFIFILFINVIFSQVSIENLDAKSLGMGGTFVTLDSNGDTYFFSPATLALKRFPQLSMTLNYPLKENPNLRLNYFYPSTSTFAFSVDLIYNPENNSYIFRNWKTALAFPLTSHIYVGASFQYVEGERDTLKGNLGILLNLWGNIRAGVVGYGLSFRKYSEKEILVTLPQGYAIGLSLKPFEKTSLFIDLLDVEKASRENSWNYLRFGLEQWIGDFIALRWGSIGDITNPLNYTLGLGLRLNILQIDLATLVAPFIAPEESQKQQYKLTGSIRF